MHHGNKTSIAESGGVGSVLHAMRNHADDKHVQKEACGTLRNLLTHHHTRESIRSHQPHRELEHAADRFPLECEDNAYSVLDRIDIQSERAASRRAPSGDTNSSN